MNLNSLACLVNHKSISEMTDEELLSHLREVRASRLQTKVSDKKLSEKSTAEKKPRKLKLPDPSDLTQDQILELLARLEK